MSKAKNVPVRKFQRIMYHDTAGAYLLGGGKGGGRVPPIIFLIFVLQNVTKLVLHFTLAAISICPGNKSWSIYELLPNCTSVLSDCHFGFELKNSYYVIINI